MAGLTLCARRSKVAGMTQTVFITGASTGLGRAAVKRFHAAGWQVAATMRNPEAGAELAALDGVNVFELDVTDAEMVKTAVAEAIARFGTIDVVFNNAGYGLAGPHEAFSDAQLQRQIETNLFGVMRTTREFLPHFRAQGAGLFITTTSIGGLIALPFNSAYHATKWALEGWSESLWFEVAQFGIGVKTVSPGGIKTDFSGRSLEMSSHSAYQESLEKAVSAFMDPSRAENASSAEQIADVVFEAATDGKDQLRYVAGADAQAMYARRRAEGDMAFMHAIKEEFLGS